jgi:hypothetical protein
VRTWPADISKAASSELDPRADRPNLWWFLAESTALVITHDKRPTDLQRHSLAPNDYAFRASPVSQAGSVQIIIRGSMVSAWLRPI